MIGSTLSHYRITAKLGEGGMGEVYRAEDARLGRDVAVKVLSAAFTADPERLARFEREARVLAALSHPNIAAVHDVGQDDGTHFLVMELAPGATLARRLASGPIPIPETIPIALQIAAALEAAHGRGIIHRDLKPANVVLGDDGRVKVLDFGLAKALDPAASTAEAPTALAHSPTLTLASTRAGMLLGTAAYMSPEQARGQPADRRSDIWSFGVVLWEMLTGARPFSGETTSDVLAAVLRADPDLAALPRDTPTAVRRLLARSLVRDPAHRLHDVADARLELEEARAGPADHSRATVQAPLERRRRWLPWGVAALLSGALVTLAAVSWRPPAEEAAVPVRMPLPLPEGYEVIRSERGIVAMSPDGRRLAAVAFGRDGISRILLRDLGALDVVTLPGTEGATTPCFSPDGGSIAFFSSEGELMALDIGSPLPRVVAQRIGSTFDRGLTWTESDWIVAAHGFEGGLHRVRANGGTPEPLTELDAARKERTHRWPFALPGGRAVLFTSDTAATAEFYDDARIEVVDLETRERKVLVDGASRAAAIPGYLIYASGGSLFAARFDEDRLEVRGDAVRVIHPVGGDPTSGTSYFAVSARGDLLYLPGDTRVPLSRLLWIDRDGTSTPAPVEPSRFVQVALSPRGRSVALTIAGDRGTDIWIADLERKGALSRLTYGGAEDPLWTPDGRQLFFDTSDQPATGGAGSKSEIFIRPADGSSDAKSVWTHDRPSHPLSITPDGRALLVEFFASPRNGDVWLVPLDGGEPRAILSTRFDEFQSKVSPDGRWIAYAADDSEAYEVYVRPFPEGAGRWQVSTGGGTEPSWSLDGREIFYRAGPNLMAVPLTPGPTFDPGLPQRVFTFSPTTLELTHSYSVTPDAQRFLVLAPPEHQPSPGLVLILHWATEVADVSDSRQR